ncbi:hypothetical protein [Streptomyces longwoodensis]|uniref:hypothetical protein n=1 Tax=Streptomyces longwoodensis TaxID=68231 RepID=UPI001B800BB7|nr:hypothetical protein [Streptomyces longwoodensis]
MADALRDRGTVEPVAETGIAVFKVAFTRWIGAPGLPGIIRASLQAMRNVAAEHTAG